MLSRDTIAETAFRLTRDEPTTPLTLNRLGTELGADPTALYRHYRNRDELLLAVVDQMYADVIARLEPARDWRTSLRSVAHAMRGVLLERPALVAEVGYRFTGGPHERRAIDITRAIFERAGLDPAQARLQVRGFGEMMLSHAAMSAASLSLPDNVRRRELEIGCEVYGLDVGSMDEYESATFESILETYLDGLAAQARAARRVKAAS
ncbi:MAG: TetR/AcrR family transcriptional regulator [Acidimicrobiales bacterium]